MVVFLLFPKMAHLLIFSLACHVHTKADVLVFLCRTFQFIFVMYRLTAVKPISLPSLKQRYNGSSKLPTPSFRPKAVFTFVSYFFALLFLLFLSNSQGNIAIAKFYKFYLSVWFFLLFYNQLLYFKNLAPVPIYGTG